MRVCIEERPTLAREGDGNSAEFAMASEFWEQERFTLARQKFMKIEQMLIWVFTSLKKKNLCVPNDSQEKSWDHFKPLFSHL